MRDDFRAALRRAVRNKGSSMSIAALLALAIALNACVFAVAYALLWKPLPFPNQGQLVQLSAYASKMGMDLGWSAPYLARVEQHARELSEVAGYQRKNMALSGEDGRVIGSIEVLQAEPALASVLGLEVGIGRVFNDADAAPGAEPAALISADLWKARFGGSNDVLAGKIHIAGSAYRIVGVLPQDFGFPTRDVQVWLPMAYSEAELAVENAGSFGSLRAVARLDQNATTGSASSEMAGLVDGEPTLAMIAEQIGLQLTAKPLRALWLEDRGQSLKSMLVASLLVFAVTLVNVYNLYMLRLLRRRQEFALLAAVGATGRRRSTQVLMEAGLLSGVATLVAAGLVPFGIALLRHFDVLPNGLPQSVGFDTATALFMVAMFAVSTVLLASAALAFRNANVFEVLRQTGNGQTASGGVHRLRRALVVGQVAVTLALLFGTALLVRSSQHMLAEDIGFNRSGQLLATLQPAAAAEDEDAQQVRTQIAAWLSEVKSVPGVEAVGLTTSAPFSENVALEGVRGPGDNESELPRAYIAHASADYLAAAGIRIVRGRNFTQSEAEAESAVAIIDADLADRYFPDADPIGRTIAVAGGPEGVLSDRTIVGVTARIRQRSLTDRDEYSSVFLPSAVPYAVPGVPLQSVEMVVRTKQPEAAARSLEARMRDAALNLRMTDVVTMEARIKDTIADLLRLSALLKILSVITVLLTAVGLYALLAHSVAMRQREFGIRLALGASPRNLRASVLGQGARMLGLAFAIGLPIALWVGVLLKPRLHGLSATDPIALIAVCLLLLVVGFAANTVPAWRASRVRPMEALRSE